MTVAHWTLSDQNLLMSDKSLTVVGHNVWTFFKPNLFVCIFFNIGFFLFFVVVFFADVQPHFCFV